MKISLCYLKTDAMLSCTFICYRRRRARLTSYRETKGSGTNSFNGDGNL
uniref:Uncharacterized protein n=1 Tax=Arundo donax TaxID=35708 RepID=A0A0A8Y896_ARUDO